MRETLDILKTYIGERPLALLIAAALVVVLIKSRDRVTRTLLGWLSLAVTALFLFPASYALYCRLDGPETYYRLLWLIPAATLLAWAVATLAVPPET